MLGGKEHPVGTRQLQISALLLLLGCKLTRATTCFSGRVDARALSLTQNTCGVFSDARNIFICTMHRLGVLFCTLGTSQHMEKNLCLKKQYV